MSKRIDSLYRPVSLDTVIGQPRAVAAARALERSGVGGRAVWIAGPSGTGKTTIARILAATIADDLCVVELVGRAVNAAALDEIERSIRLYGFGRGGRVWIINEAQGLGRAAIERLLDLTESLPAHASIMFTTTADGEERLFDDQIDAGPLLSRCAKIRTTNQGFAQPMAERLRVIAGELGLDGQPVSAYLKLMQRCKNNARAALLEIESGCMLATTGVGDDR